jgi:ADP-ribose pyrophosphatase
MRKLFEEKTMKTEEIFQGKIIKVRVDTVLLPDGNTATREVVEHPGAVAIIAVNERREVLFVRQFRKPIEDVLLELPAGKLDLGEEPLACAQRELEEETGYRAKEWKHLFSFYTSPGFSNEILHLMVAQSLEMGQAHPDGEEFLEVVWVPLEQARQMIFEGEIRDAKTIIGICALDYLVRENAC